MSKINLSTSFQTLKSNQFLFTGSEKVVEIFKESNKLKIGSVGLPQIGKNVKKEKSRQEISSQINKKKIFRKKPPIL
ncbi:unnamed protein product, partial [Nesidiocoris tenuis]